MPIPLGILAVAGAGAAGGGGSFDLLETTLISTNTASVTFSGLGAYSAYKHLQIRATVKSTDRSAIRVRFNGDTGNNYVGHDLTAVPDLSGTPSSGVNGAGGTSYFYTIPITTTTANVFGAGYFDILDFSNTSKNKTVRSLGGAVDTAVTFGEIISLRSGLWMSTSAITSIYLDADGTNFVSGCRFSLYGVK